MLSVMGFFSAFDAFRRTEPFLGCTAPISTFAVMMRGATDAAAVFFMGDTFQVGLDVVLSAKPAGAVGGYPVRNSHGFAYSTKKGTPDALDSLSGLETSGGTVGAALYTLIPCGTTRHGGTLRSPCVPSYSWVCSKARVRVPILQPYYGLILWWY